MTWPAPNTARLEPLSPTHAPGLIEAVTDGNLWELWYTSIPSPKEMEANITRRLALQAKDEMLPFTIFNQATGQTIGMTTYMNIDAANRHVEIGSTWTRKSAQRSGINTECKLLLLAHAFETLNCIAVEFRTHFFNHQSRRAIERLGARQDGILRSHRVNAEGLLRDTVVYSIIAAEWPTIRQHLRFLTARPPASRIE
jgi:RimJ/RimL family protein N-acetyltransferase